jgi:GNAT superfamily N-acetyltransferase
MVTFRFAELEDAPVLAELVRGAYRGGEGWTTEAHLLDDERIDVAEVEKKILEPDGVVLVAVGPDGGIAGCCEIVYRGHDVAYFGLFAVRPAQQAAGLGRLVLAEAEDVARRRWSAGVMEMTVIAQRAELIAWYERRGYTVTAETRPFPFSELINGKALRDDLYFVVLTKRLVSDLRPAGQ